MPSTSEHSPQHLAATLNARLRVHVTSVLFDQLDRACTRFSEADDALVVGYALLDRIDQQPTLSKQLSRCW
ncbi:MAG: hypothetical protein ACPH15_05890, partial [Pseudomonadales bacterium]